MKRKLLCLVLTNVLGMTSCMFFHDLSPFAIKPENVNNTHFGYAISYQKNTKTLVVGAPNDRTGKVLACPLDLESSMLGLKNKCLQYDTSYVEKLPDMKRYEENYKFRLGASVAALPHSFLTCAPMWTGNFTVTTKHSTFKKLFIWGACFEVNEEGKFETLEGFYSIPRNRAPTMGNFGLKILVDDVNEIVLISKPATPNLYEDIAYKKFALKTTESLVIDELLKTNDRKIEMKNRLQKYRNLGTAMAAGKFFNLPNMKTIYAVSLSDDYTYGGVIFVKNYLKYYFLNIIDKGRDSAMLRDKKYSLFGAALCSATLNDDEYSDLIVGAPAGYDDSKREYGAIHIYMGTYSLDNFMKRKLMVMGKTEGSRFGTNIIAHDLDNDGLQEIFVTALYENSGVLYILSGFEMNKKLEEASARPVINVVDFTSRQEIEKKDFNLLGFSITPISDLDDNGCDELAVGAPGNDAVMVFRCIPTVEITVNAKLLGHKEIPEETTDFQIEVCIYLKYESTKVGEISANNYVTIETFIDNSRRVIIAKDDRKFTLNISSKEEKYCHNVNLTLTDHKPGHYEFQAKANLESGIFKTSATFDKSWVRISPYSKLQSEPLPIERECKGDDCIYNLEMTFQWSGGTTSNYSVGVKDEVVTLQIKNRGRITYNTCVLINVVGVIIINLECGLSPQGYSCPLPEDFMKNAEWNLQIRLNTSHPTNEFKGLEVAAVLFKDCSIRTSPQKKVFNVEYEFDNYIDTQISVEGSPSTRSITEKSLKAQSDTIDVVHTYMIENKGNIDWKNVTMVISSEASFVKELKVNLDRCTTNQLNSKKCLLDLKPASTAKVIVTVVLGKNENEKSLMSNKLKISTDLSLILTPTSRKKQHKVEAIPMYEKDSTLGQNKTLITIIAVIVAIIIIAIFIFILYKVGFFKRKQKKELREEIKRQSMLPYEALQRQESQIDLTDDKTLEDDDFNRDGLPAQSARLSRRTSRQSSVKDVAKLNEEAAEADKDQ